MIEIAVIAGTVHTHTHTHTLGNLIDLKRVVINTTLERIYIDDG